MVLLSRHLGLFPSPGATDCTTKIDCTLDGICGCLQYSLTRVQRAAVLNSEEGWVYPEDDALEPLPDEIVISVSAPCQLMGVGLCGTIGAFTVDVEVLLHADQVCSCPCLCRADCIP